MIAMFVGLIISFCFCTTPTTLPRITLSDITNFEGAFRIPAGQFGGSGDEWSVNFAAGALHFHRERNSIFIIGFEPTSRIAEFKVPNITNSKVVTELEMSDDPVQGFLDVIQRTNNTQNLNRIGGLYHIPGTESLIFNVYEYYDADTSVTITTGRIDDLTNIAGSSITGYYTIEGGPCHTSSWISPIPFEWVDLLSDGDLTKKYLAGSSSGIPIIGRCSVGPAAFSFNAEEIIDENPDDSIGEVITIPSFKLLDYYLSPEDRRLDADLSNDSRQNKLWTHLSRATYGFIAPSSSTYVVLGESGGHSSGVCYKCTPSCGTNCGGYCPYVCNDEYMYYWLYDVNDLLAIRNGTMESWEARPYEYGIFPSQFNSKSIAGASFDTATNRLFVVESRADRNQGEYSNPPIITVYRVGNGTWTPSTPTLEVDQTGEKMADRGDSGEEAFLLTFGVLASVVVILIVFCVICFVSVGIFGLSILGVLLVGAMGSTVVYHTFFIGKTSGSVVAEKKSSGKVKSENELEDVENDSKE